MVLLAEQLLLFCLKLTWCCCFFQNIKQPTNRLVLSVLIVFLPIVCKLVVLKVTTIEQLLEFWKICKSFFAVYLGQAKLVNKTVFRMVSSYIQELR